MNEKIIKILKICNRFDSLGKFEITPLSSIFLRLPLTIFSIFPSLALFQQELLTNFSISMSPSGSLLNSRVSDLLMLVI